MLEPQKKELKSLFETMCVIRCFEEKGVELTAKGKLPGFLHLYIGEEAIAAGVCSNLRRSDLITSTHRGHGHLIAKGGDVDRMMAELYGKATGYCGGKGGSMHICDLDCGIVGANGIVGGGIPIAAGVGFSIKYRKSDQVAVCFFGDGASNQGGFHESLNMASIWNLPIVYVCENNQYGISLHCSKHQNVENIADRAKAYNIPGMICDGNDVLDVKEKSSEAIALAKNGQGPVLLECKTYRIRGHAEGDGCNYRSEREVEEWLAKDPLKNFRRQALSKAWFAEEELDAVWDACVAKIENAVQFAIGSSYPKPEALFENVYV
ncbi:MAG: thiamine pyrophosphate-dependent dehydrogenase E1 component subunit alpha [Clostridiales Family XIII bacterium]|jgi:pyruvate dehydrogenase E1 component alpha subunit|nr:thiamine pyrophosphate-dependent dehydrogenase E1 component subunit alpha [Clostridiales Family XIII bacterium]